MAKVLVVNKSCHDFQQAEEYGELVYMTEGAIGRFNTSKMFRAFKPFIDNSNPEDYILLTGLAVMNSIACAMFAAKHGKVNLLIYKDKKGQQGMYIEKTVVV